MAFGVAEVLLEIDPINGKAKECVQRRQPRAIQRLSRQELAEIEKQLESGYQSLKADAQILEGDMSSPIFSGIAEDQDEMLSILNLISRGKVASAISVDQPVSVREAARVVLSKPDKATDLIAEDFDAVVRWMTSSKGELDVEKVRDRLLKRQRLLEAALPDSMRRNCTAAFQQIEREHLRREYANEETMLGDKIEEIPPANFFVSEDNYAFDMDELASWITVRNGVMRNPLSLQMFSESDIRTILDHPIGKKLRPLDEAQHRLRGGARPATITHIEKLGNIMLQDQSMDANPSRKGIDEFLGYVATLPQSEQTTIRELRIPATDKNTGQPFDYSISESVSDAKAGVTCYHKVR